MAHELRVRKIWDCDSCLYDSFELRSFKQQLDSAISSRCMSMPRLSDPIPTPIVRAPKKGSKVLRSVRKMIRSVFKSKSSSDVTVKLDHALDSRYLRLGPLSTIPETSEKGVESPDLDSIVRRSVSDRFTASSGVLIR